MRCNPAPSRAITAHAVPETMGDNILSTELATIAIDPANRETSSTADTLLHRDVGKQSSCAAGSSSGIVSIVVLFSSPKNRNRPLDCNAVDSHARYMAMTKRSAAAMELRSSVACCGLCDSTNRIRAVAKKLMDPPMYDAHRQLAAMAASVGLNHNVGHQRQR